MNSTNLTDLLKQVIGEIENPTETKDAPKDAVYNLTGPGPSIANGNTWAESEVIGEPKLAALASPPTKPAPVEPPTPAVAMGRPAPEPAPEKPTPFGAHPCQLANGDTVEAWVDDDGRVESIASGPWSYLLRRGRFKGTPTLSVMLRGADGREKKVARMGARKWSAVLALSESIRHWIQTEGEQ